MSVSFVLPTLLGVALVATMGLRDWNLRPKIALPLLTGLMVVAASAVVLVAFSAASAFVLGPVRSTALVNWCRTIPLHHEVSPLIGIAALTATVSFTIRCSRIIVSRRRSIRSAGPHRRVSVVESDEPFAYAVPSRQGCVVVSTGLLEPLTSAERRAVFAHERAHLQLRHHHYLFAAELSRAILPFLAPITRQIQHATERAADEAAVVAVRDRRVVARAIATTALAPQHVGATLPALGAGSVTRRVEALLWPDRERVATTAMSSMALFGGLTAFGSLAVQMHHFSTLLEHLCRGTG